MNVIGRVTTGRCNHDFFRGGSKFNYSIGNPASCGDSQSAGQPQDVGVDNHNLEGILNHAVDGRLKVYGALWCVPAGFMSRKATLVDSGSTSHGGPAGCGEGSKGWYPGKGV
jgi:hypothetical protein